MLVIRRIGAFGATAWRLLEDHFVIAMLCLVILAAALRFHEYTSAPVAANDPDEMAWTWAGQSLLQDGSPTSWTSLPAYPNVTWQQTQVGTVAIVHPWLDQPPVFSLLVGGTALIAGEKTREAASVTAVRVPVIALSLISLILSAILMRTLFGAGVALVATGLLAVSPAITMASRTVESEALVAPMLLGTLLLCHRIERGRAGRIGVAGLLAICCIAPLVKLPGFVCPLVAAGLLWTSGRGRLALAAVAAGLAGVGVFALYGAALDWHQFTTVMATNGRRVDGFLNAYSFITSELPLIAQPNRLHDVIWLLGWIGIGFVVLSRRGAADRYLAWPCLAYVIIMVAAASPSLSETAAWYRIPVMPLVYGAAALLIWEGVARFNVVAVGLVLAVMSTAALRGFALGEHPAAPNGALVALVVLAVIAWSVRRRRTGVTEPQTASGWSVAVPAILMMLILATNGVQSWSLITTQGQL